MTRLFLTMACACALNFVGTGLLFAQDSSLRLAAAKCPCEAQCRAKGQHAECGYDVYRGKKSFSCYCRP